MLRMGILHHHHDHASHRGRESKPHKDVNTEHMPNVGATASVVAANLLVRGASSGTNRMAGATDSCGGTYDDLSNCDKPPSDLCSHSGVHTQAACCASEHTRGAAGTRVLTDDTGHGSEHGEMHDAWR